MVPHPDGAGRNDESPVRRSQRVARSQPREDAGEEEGVGKEPMNSEQGTQEFRTRISLVVIGTGTTTVPEEATTTMAFRASRRFRYRGRGVAGV
jgi:hypothetical protein